jgi:hypothetical protein
MVGVTPRQRLTFLEDEAEPLATIRKPAPPAKPLLRAIDAATAAAVDETRQAFFGIRGRRCQQPNRAGPIDPQGPGSASQVWLRGDSGEDKR